MIIVRVYVNKYGKSTEKLIGEIKISNVSEDPIISDYEVNVTKEDNSGKSFKIKKFERQKGIWVLLSKCLNKYLKQ